MHPDTTHVFPEDGSFPEFKEEALRRFAAGTSILTPDKLEDIRVLLTKERFLKPKELEDDPEDIEEALALHSYLSSSSAEARGYLANLPRHFEAERVGDGMKEHFILKLNLDPSGEYFCVENIYEREVDPESHNAGLEKKDDYKSCRQYRRGYGFVCTNQNLLYLFTHGPVRQDILNYVQVVLKEPLAEKESLQFMVSGLKVPILQVPLEYKVNKEDSLVNFNTLEFTQPISQAVLDALLDDLADG
jgi:hypothetical protein